MNSAPHLLDELVKLTSIRDAELLEHSLLRTLQDILSPVALSLFRTNGGQPCYHMVCDALHGPRMLAEPAVSAETLAAAAAATAHEMRDPQRLRRADGSELAVYPVIEMRGFTTFLEVITAPERVGEDARLIDGFLRFYENYCDLLDYSQRDQLTGLMNRKTFDDSVYKLFGNGDRRHAGPRALLDNDRRHGGPGAEFWLGMIDIDHFKRINDNFGHLYGDEVLLLAAQEMQRKFRDSDLLFRFGGEEFVVIMQNVDRERALHVFERLRESIAAFRFPQVGQVTISAGLVQLKAGTLTPLLLDQADKALYWAKQNGRNRVAVYEDLLERGVIEVPHTAQGSVDLF